MNILKIAEKYYDEMLNFTKKLGVIPAPSGDEGRRAEFVLSYMKRIGAENAYIDSAKNVICTLGDNEEDGIALFMAHTDIVFPEETPLIIEEDEEHLRFPGITDDVACLAVLMAGLKYLLDNKISPKRKLMFVANSCEEGLGNLKGCRQIFQDFGDKIDHMYTFDGLYNHLVNDSVGSHRYEVTAITEGGHSFGAFGNRNAINVLAGIVKNIYDIEVPKVDDSKTTYNVGTISGGTSVNTIAENATMLVEYRSDNYKCLMEMQKKYSSIFENAKSECSDLQVTLVGDRPCKCGVDDKKLQSMTNEAIQIYQKYLPNTDIEIKSGSTDCNIPHSLGIPALCIGVCDGGGAHTKGEWLIKSSLIPGFAIGLSLILKDGGIDI